jgi:protein AbiQ
MQVKGMNYYVPVSSFDKKQEANILIRVPGDEKYRSLLNKEYQFCMDNAERIQKKADKIYEMVTTNRKQILTDNSCAFHILEAGYREYIEKNLKA